MIAPVKLVAAAVGILGTAVALTSGVLVVRGPFLGGPMLAPPSLLVALGAFVVGAAGAAWGLTRYERA
ncbi:hypothetical protein [Haloplanus sp.]|uniref:hypothetical protein n=1 Tax=Haloplanus sp. TaxID=1961696 RepID=UPI00262D4397|nr:hypothetical protein [Haloplanus sp.]